MLRKHLKAAGIERSELHVTTQARLRLRVHDLRGTFVTVGLANGATESWISDRTGHKSSAKINRYKRAARTVVSALGLGRLKPIVEAIPEFAAAKPVPSPEGDPRRPRK